MPAASAHRRLFAASAALASAILFIAMVLVESPGLGIGHFFYIPIALVALAYGSRGGAFAGLAAAGLYALAIVCAPTLPWDDAITIATVIRLVTYTGSGLLLGWFADRNGQLFEQLRALAERDFLTGLFNTRVFDEALARRCQAEQPFVLLLGDMDNLKALNDTHGHAAGNTELRRLADALSRLTRPEDELARVGGDEFAILTSGTVADAPALCEALRVQLAADSLHVTFGWAALPDDGAGALELFRKADDRLYAAKLVQRNHHIVREALAARA